MTTCPTCGSVVEEDDLRCNVRGCFQPAYYEGWYRVVDPFGIPTGLIQLQQVCKDHKSMLIGGEEEK